MNKITLTKDQPTAWRGHQMGRSAASWVVKGRPTISVSSDGLGTWTAYDLEKPEGSRKLVRRHNRAALINALSQML
ncbi:MAG: hypothetical protein ACO3EL_06215 [Burkholderiaceae bacterium]